MCSMWLCVKKGLSKPFYPIKALFGYLKNRSMSQTLWYKEFVRHIFPSLHIF